MVGQALGSVRRTKKQHVPVVRAEKSRVLLLDVDHWSTGNSFHYEQCPYNR